MMEDDESFFGLLLYAVSGVNFFSVLIALCLGLIFGSFLNVVIYRLPLQRSVVVPGSACGSCGVPLRWYHNIPVLSYLFQSGTCAYCGSPFSSRYMWIELATGLGAVGLLYHDLGFGVAWCYHFALFCVALAVFWTDVDHWIIPDEVNLFGVLFGTAFSVLMPNRADMYLFEDLLGWNVASNLYSSLVGVAVGWLFFKFIQFLGLLFARQEAMGEGDVKYAAVLGAFLGWQMALGAFFLSFLLGAVYAIPLLLSRAGRGKDPVPFGTFMSLAAVPVALWGNDLYRYLSFEIMI
ncbi:prepilin peptidase [bacterium]|nr:prepilin peptidase [bacterium]